MWFCFLVILVLQIVNTFYLWKLERDFQEWATDINVEFFKNFKE